jgi:hypothetical protein
MAATRLCEEGVAGIMGHVDDQRGQSGRFLQWIARPWIHHRHQGVFMERDAARKVSVTARDGTPHKPAQQLNRRRATVQVRLVKLWQSITLVAAA